MAIICAVPAVGSEEQQQSFETWRHVGTTKVYMALLNMKQNKSKCSGHVLQSACGKKGVCSTRTQAMVSTAVKCKTLSLVIPRERKPTGETAVKNKFANKTLSENTMF